MNGQAVIAARNTEDERQEIDLEEDEMSEEPANQMPSATQWPYAAIVAITAVVAVAVVAAVAIYHYTKASDAVTVLGPVTAVISALVAAYFGIRAGTLTQQKQNENEALKRLPAKPS